MSTEMLIRTLMVAVALGGIYTLISLGLTLVYGVTRVFHYAMGSFFAWGAYIAWALLQYTNLEYGAVFGITIGIMFLFGLLYERIFIYFLYSSRRFADWRWTAIIVTLGSALLLDNLALVIFGPLGKTLPRIVEGVFKFGDIAVSKHDVATLLITITMVIILTLFLRKTREGMAMRGVAQDAVGANIVGIPISRMFSYTFGIAAALGGIAGMLLVPRTQLFPTVGWPIFTKALVVVVFGGLGSVPGTLIAAFTLAVVEVFATFYIGAHWSLAIFLGVLVITLVFKPKGLFGLW